MYGTNAKNAISAGVPNSRAELDFYCTDPDIVRALLEVEPISENVWEPAAGAGHIVGVLKEFGKKVVATDIAVRSEYPDIRGGVDFLSTNGHYNGTIMTNPPFAKNGVMNFVLKALEIIEPDPLNKIIMYAKINFLESCTRYEKLFKDRPPKVVYLFPMRPKFGKVGSLSETSNTEMHCWVVWDTITTPHEPVIKWLFPKKKQI